MKTYILLGKIEDIDRLDMERIEATIYPESTLVEDFGGKIKKYSLSDFMDLCNNEEIILDNYWVSYIHINED